MDTVLMVIGILGLGALIIAAYVFTVAARNYVSETSSHEGEGDAIRYIKRSPHERRTVTQTEFPFTVNGVLVSEDRRCIRDRRLAA